MCVCKLLILTLFPIIQPNAACHEQGPASERTSCIPLCQDIPRPCPQMAGTWSFAPSLLKTRGNNTLLIESQ